MPSEAVCVCVFFLNLKIIRLCVVSIDFVIIVVVCLLFCRFFFLIHRKFVSSLSSGSLLTLFNFSFVLFFSVLFCHGIRPFVISKSIRTTRKMCIRSRDSQRSMSNLMATRISFFPFFFTSAQFKKILFPNYRNSTGVALVRAHFFIFLIFFFFSFSHLCATIAHAKLFSFSLARAFRGTPESSTPACNVTCQLMYGRLANLGSIFDDKNHEILSYRR